LYPECSPQHRQSIDGCLPVEGPEDGVAPQHHAASAAVSALDQSEAFVPAGTLEQHAVAVVAAVLFHYHGEASVVAEALQQHAVAVVAAVLLHYHGEASVVAAALQQCAVYVVAAVVAARDHGEDSVVAVSREHRGVSFQPTHFSLLPFFVSSFAF